MNPLQFHPNRPFDLIAIGRLCIDLNANEINRPMEETRTFTKYVGGSPANIAIGSARLGQKTGFIGKVANDQMGRFITDYLEKNGIDTTGVKIDHTGAVTGLAFTEIKSPEDCSILMYRDNVADLKLHPSDVDEQYIKQAKALLVSGTALAKSPSREAVFLALEYAVKHDVTVFFDLDYRPYTWTDEAETAVYYNLAAEKCDVIIGTREEFDMMEKLLNVKESDDHYTASRWFSYRAKLVVIKHGGSGSIAYTKDGAVHRSGIFRTQVLKTFGAGDSYASAFIYGLMKGKDVSEAMKWGSASASIVISRHSCSDAMPTWEELEQYMETAVYEPV
ncbi:MULTISPECIES: 5-dehydro-2-deoxygluconokinase [Neobacillus]|jgi:5-dehydro-2-deoxygluconokinase|uniref:5-dehydro-2-deoxygluconokinase n=1 Tax=Neobacillus sedimentimangrovi TaxID=2699460 RepID=A0ABS8QEJ7_9BACI|nr:MULTISPECIES: 5-dehydro-2-deoxygluconokinase [Neobacillus]MCD4837552.1 5-dehydro-2-deoxygluconokinase [Neobacillus sedimentimangrovi]MED3625370.1 5-dehydro-2-deoxygluconokinase [Neobacillus thermocopriae]MED3714074.1 5-dehydro-2-deoxygluconokinase [Neobacillus thermocopriae]